MDFNSILINLPIGALGAVIGFLVGKLFDIWYKKYEFTLEAKKIFYIKKIECGESCVQYIESMNDHILKIVHISTQLIENPDFNKTLFDNHWDKSQNRLAELGDMIMDKYNKANFYFNLDEGFDYDRLANEIHENSSKVMNMVENKDYNNSHTVLREYIESMRKLSKRNSEVVKLIKKQSKF
ncbi:MAG: hypothetical protein OQJ96_10770 [Flavobacteriales bacterium]|nr:hypothetical protein [Flavobacteriales bacterium]MCW8912239.1 hypothetical protein [Flavobacteriales bacterium]MCW8937522.1 hypothetical protein [Flavobacteriales bacterium]MCW8967153.1 hypothetical protein [Flavobacteriales bacterium]MCW8989145.1 hypothetical protein [Flavobacteriales bacterium]